MAQNLTKAPNALYADLFFLNLPLVSISKNHFGRHLVIVLHSYMWTVNLMVGTATDENRTVPFSVPLRWSVLKDQVTTQCHTCWCLSKSSPTGSISIPVFYYYPHHVTLYASSPTKQYMKTVQFSTDIHSSLFSLWVLTSKTIQGKLMGHQICDTKIKVTAYRYLIRYVQLHIISICVMQTEDNIILK